MNVDITNSEKKLKEDDDQYLETEIIDKHKEVTLYKFYCAMDKIPKSSNNSIILPWDTLKHTYDISNIDITTQNSNLQNKTKNGNHINIVDIQYVMSKLKDQEYYNMENITKVNYMVWIYLVIITIMGGICIGFGVYFYIKSMILAYYSVPLVSVSLSIP